MQSRQKVQSMLPCLRCWKSQSSQPRIADCVLRVPLMQSLVRQAVQVWGSRTRTSSGETSEVTKLNWPMGQTYLQKGAPRNRLSISNTPAK